jgi:hypothetical protein
MSPVTVLQRLNLDGKVICGPWRRDQSAIIIGLPRRECQKVTKNNDQRIKPYLFVSFQRKDTKQYGSQVFSQWAKGLEFARWVADSPEHDLLSLRQTSNSTNVSQKS